MALEIGRSSQVSNLDSTQLTVTALFPIAAFPVARSFTYSKYFHTGALLDDGAAISTPRSAVICLAYQTVHSHSTTGITDQLSTCAA